jgi:hypothetical protein
MMSRASLRVHLPFMLVALVLAYGSVRYFNEQPGYTDAYYHYNAAAQLASGRGLTDDYLWTFIGAPDTLPAPSHLYWMPGTSLIAAVGMAFFGVNYPAAQMGLILTLWGAACIAYWLGGYVGGTARHRWAAGLLLLAGGYYLRFWGQTDTFAPYAFFGALALALMGLAAKYASSPNSTSEKDSKNYRYLYFACVAAGHLIRSDGLLLLLVGWIVIGYELIVRRKQFTPSGDFGKNEAFRRVEQDSLPLSTGEGLGIGVKFLIFTLAYALVMLPWFARNLTTIGTVLPTGGTQAVWYTRYDDLFNYPPDASPQTFFANGLGLFIESRWDAFWQNLGTVVAVEGIVIFAPFMLLALWTRRRDPFWRGVIWFAIGIHAAFTLAFPFPGVRGGLLHAAAALMPFWVVLGVVRIDDVVDWVARRRKRWHPQTAKRIFTLGALLSVIWFSLTIALPRRVTTHTPELYAALDAYLPPDARIMINDPSLMYYFTGRGGTTFPNEPPETMLTLARQYDLDYVLLEIVGEAIAVPYNLRLNPDAPPAFMREVPHNEFQSGGVRLYEFVENP